MKHVASPSSCWRTLVQYSGYGVILLWAASGWGQDTTPMTENTAYVRGVKAFAEGDYKAAAELWLADAYLGSADAQFNIGVLYVEGKGLPKDRAEAVFWFTKAAGQGNREAQYNLGHLLLEESDDVDKIRQGIEWWRKSAEAGFPVAQYNYGRALFHGIGTDADRPGSRQWFERAANGGNDKAVAFLAENNDRFVDAPPAIEISEPLAIRSPEPNLEIASAPTIALINGSEYVLVNDSPILVYARFNNFSPIITRVDERMLFRVVKRSKGWILAELPGGLPGWVRNEGVRIEEGLVEIVAPSVPVRADPTEGEESNDIGELPKGSKVLLLEQQPGWTRVQLPERIPGWIAEAGVRPVVAKAEEIAKVWQNQRVKRKLAIMAGREDTVAAASGLPRAATDNAPMPFESADVSRDTELLAAAVTDDVRDTALQTIVVASRESAVPPARKTPVNRAESDQQKSISIVVEPIAGRSADSGDSSSETLATAAAPPESPPTVRTATSSGNVADSTASEAPESKADAEISSSILRTSQQDVAVRSGPQNDAASIITLPKHSLVDILDRRAGFARVSLPGGIPVWIEAAAARERDGDIEVERDRTRARSRPAADEPVVGLLPRGSALRVLERQEGWLRVVAPGMVTGWIAEVALEAPSLPDGLDQTWQQQAQSLLATYGSDTNSKLATEPRVDNETRGGTGIRNDNRWLFEPSSREYTLQLFSMQNRESAEALMGELNGRGQFYSTVVKGGRWYYILFGKFLTAGAAEAMAAKLPAWANGARVRSLARLQANRCKKIDQLNDEEASNLVALCR